ncbi:DNA polymerase I [Lederbergia panacisoli]|uniref:DNA polymerase I n=1 Tax=Lederbergia panacisoli TaxID=1255251 RepID=UPI00214BBB92|nr:DNA polymerase I [Lederbergia panacisoli]MCR2821911.1 DNA polymerase I [Lederbergia panacisoli]
MKKKLMLIDGNSIAYRAFFALPLLSSDKGIHTNAVYGFTTMLMKVLEEEKPTHILVAFDAGKTTFRHSTFKEYKGGRQKTPPELSEQFPFLRELLDAYGIKRYELENYEADDIIGTLATQAEKEGFDVQVISGDKDLTQLSTDKITVSITRKGITDIESYTPEYIKEKYSLSADQIIDMKGLMGDQSDNIPGVPGVGEKTAIKLLVQFDTLENLLNNIDKVSGNKLKERLEEFKDQAIMSKELATITKEAPVDITVDELLFEGYDPTKLSTIFKELGFSSLLDKIDGADDSVTEEVKEITYETVETITDDLFADENAFYVEILDDNYFTGEMIGFALSNEKGDFYLPVDKALGSEAFKKWAEDEEKKKRVYDAKLSIVALRRKGIDLKGIDFDLLLASYLLNPTESTEDFAGVAKRHNYTNVKTDEAVYGKGAKKKAAEGDILAEHLVRKAIGIGALTEPCLKELDQNEQTELFYDLELPLSLVLAEMEYTGVKVDVSRLENMQIELAERLTEIESKIHELAGENFNINSPKQLGVILFEKLGLPAIKKTKTGFSTSADVLEKLEHEHEIIKEILIYRQLGKLQSTYIEGLLKVVHKDTSKVHTRFNQVLAATGRLSSIDPNLQNIPIRLEEGRKIRQAFIPSEEDWVIFAADYSQIELRVLAEIAQDDNLKSAFTHNMDIHTKTAMDVFHVAEEEVDSNMRRQAKAVNFGIVYGISDYGLSQNLGITRKEAGKFIERYLESFAGVKNFMDDIIVEAREKGFVSTLLHRRRYIPEITSRNFNLRSFAERTAMNTPIQGSAADIIKKAMIDMAERLKSEGLKTRLLLQVHDELIFETPNDEVEKLIQIVPDVMENALPLSVPLKVEYSYGPTWFDAK